MQLELIDDILIFIWMKKALQGAFILIISRRPETFSQECKDQGRFSGISANYVTEKWDDKLQGIYRETYLADWWLQSIEPLVAWQVTGIGLNFEALGIDELGDLFICSWILLVCR